jgi:hypothetical protein
MADLWAVEARVKGCDPQTRLDARRAASAPIVDELQMRWESELTGISGKSKLAEAIRYGLSRKAEFRRFLEDGRVELDNNSVERAIRPQTITRKNALFAGSEAGGQTACDADRPTMFAGGGSRDGLTDSRTAFWKPGLKNGVRRRDFYEDRNARISILAGGSPRGRIR